VKCVAIGTAILAFLIGLRAAHLWYQASKVGAHPFWEHDGRIEPVDPTLASQHMIVALNVAAQESGALNRHAAIWTAFSVAASAASALFGAFA